MNVKYQIRRWNDHGSYQWEVWQWVRHGWLFNRGAWYRVSVHPTSEEAGAMIVRLAEPHYDKTADFDAQGQAVIHGW